MAHKIEVDIATGTAVRTVVAPEEEAERRAVRAALDRQAEVDGRRRAFVDGLRPDAALLRKVKAGEPMTDGERDRLLSWLAARELAGEIID